MNIGRVIKNLTRF